MGQHTAARDFGWRLRGQAVTVMPDRSLDLASHGPNGAFLEPYCRDVAALRSCLQCGACTASCGLAEKDSLFPRQQMTFVRLGLEDRLILDSSIWHCYGCNECSSRCPSGVEPSLIMAALRHLATERFAFPSAVARIVSDPRRFWLVYAAAAIILAGLVAATGAVAPGAGPLRYDGMVPDAALIVVFSGFTILALLAAGVGAMRAWRGWHATTPSRAGPGVLSRALVAATSEILAHRRFADCEERRRSAWLHRSVLAGFLGLLGITAIVTILLPLGLEYPFAIDHPLKVAGNAFAVLLIVGAGSYLIGRAVDTVHGRASPFFDWHFVANLLLVGLTGLAAEVLRFADVRAAAYPVYFVHLVLVFVLLVTLPYTKLAHALYRVLAVTARKADVIMADEASRPERSPVRDVGLRTGMAPGVVGQPVPVAAASDPATIASLGHDALAAWPDATLTVTYDALRDKAVSDGGVRRYPNIRRLHGTAFEREKDRREVRALVRGEDKPEVQAWYEDAATRTCAWWMDNHLVARHALGTCMACGMCTSVCPAAEHDEQYDPRGIVDVALSRDEHRLVALLESDLLWQCLQCGSCTGRCPQENDVMSLVSSLRCLAQLKGFHVRSVRGRQQYVGRHLWGGNLWNRAFSLYFRDGDAARHPDYGPRFARWVADQDTEYARVGGQPDMDGTFAGRKVEPATLAELRGCIRVGGGLYLWDRIEEHGAAQAAELGLDLDSYHEKVRTDG